MIRCPKPVIGSMKSVVLTLGLLLAGCAITPGSRPHDMGTEQHEAAAEREERIAADHASQYDPNAGVTATRCRAEGRATLRGESDLCWTSVENPTAAHREAAEKHRRYAADHRAASAALRDAEARACAGIPPADRDMSPFEHVEDIESVTPLVLPEYEARDKMPNERLLGAQVVFRAVPGMTVEWLQHLVDCHLARNASLGHDVPEMPDCPLVPNGATAAVSTTGRGFSVSVQSGNPATAREILARAMRLVDHSAAARDSRQQH